jgi:hypothetical protein
MLWAYRRLRLLADTNRRRYEQAVAQVDRVLDKLAEEHCAEQLDKLDDLRRELRLLVKGTPLTEAITPADKEPILTHRPGFSQRQYDAETALLKNVYKKLAMMCHPDRPGGDREAWDEVEAAYAMRDINRLNAIYLTLVQGRNLYWQQSDGAYHVSSEAERYNVEIERMKQTQPWKIARLYLSGAVNTAVDTLRLYLADQIAALLNEINYVILKGIENGEERKGNQELEGTGQESGQGRESQQEGQGREG